MTDKAWLVLIGVLGSILLIYLAATAGKEDIYSDEYQYEQDCGPYGIFEGDPEICPE